MTQKLNRRARRGRRARQRNCSLRALRSLRFASVKRAQPPQTGVQVLGRSDVARRHRRGRPTASRSRTSRPPTSSCASTATRARRHRRVGAAVDGAPTAGAAAPPDGYSTNENATGGRLIVIAIDQPNIRFGGAMAIARRPTRSSIACSRPIGSPSRASASAPRRPRSRPTARGSSRPSPAWSARRRPSTWRITISRSWRRSPSIDRGDETMLSRFSSASAEPRTAGAREARATPRSRSRCARWRWTSSDEADETMQALRDLFLGLRAIDAPKTLIFISEGFVLSDRGWSSSSARWPRRRARASTP